MARAAQLGPLVYRGWLGGAKYSTPALRPDLRLWLLRAGRQGTTCTAVLDSPARFTKSCKSFAEYKK
jgi:hypothetical protein